MMEVFKLPSDEISGCRDRTKIMTTDKFEMVGNRTIAVSREACKEEDAASMKGVNFKENFYFIMNIILWSSFHYIVCVMHMIILITVIMFKLYALA